MISATDDDLFLSASHTSNTSNRPRKENILSYPGYVRIRIRRWLFRKKEDWTEPALPPWVKVNPQSPPGSHDEGLQPGDISMAKVAEEFLDGDD